MRMLTCSLLILLPATVGCVPNVQQGVAFNQAIVEANQELLVAGISFGTVLGQVLEGEDPTEGRALQEEYENTKQVLQKVSDDMQRLPVPDHESAKALYTAHQSFLQVQQEIIDKDFAELVAIATNDEKDLPTKQQEAHEVLERVGESETKSLETLQRQQQVFARAFRIRLE